MNNQDEKIGLSSGNRKLLVTLLFIGLLLFSPVEPYGIFVRTALIVLLPVLLWFSLGYFGKKWDIDKEANDRLNRAIVGMLAGALFIGAYLSLTSHYHNECTQYTHSRDGDECVGDYIRVPGGDKAGALIEGLFGVWAAWYAIAKHKEE